MAIEGYPELNIPPSQMGNAHYCWKSVFLNLIMTTGLIVWLEWIFLLIPLWVSLEYPKSDLDATVSKVKTLGFLFVLVLFLIFVLDAPDWVLQPVIIIYAVAVRIHSIRMYIHQFRNDASLNDNSSLSMFKRGLLGLYLVPDDGTEEVHHHQE